MFDIILTTSHTQQLAVYIIDVLHEFIEKLFSVYPTTNVNKSTTEESAQPTPTMPVQSDTPAGSNSVNDGAFAAHEVSEEGQH